MVVDDTALPTSHHYPHNHIVVRLSPCSASHLAINVINRATIVLCPLSNGSYVTILQMSNLSAIYSSWCLCWKRHALTASVMASSSSSKSFISAVVSHYCPVHQTLLQTFSKPRLAAMMATSRNGCFYLDDPTRHSLQELLAIRVGAFVSWATINEASQHLLAQNFAGNHRLDQSQKQKKSNTQQSVTLTLERWGWWGVNCFCGCSSWQVLRNDVFQHLARNVEGWHKDGILDNVINKKVKQQANDCCLAAFGSELSWLRFFLWKKSFMLNWLHTFRCLPAIQMLTVSVLLNCLSY